MGLKPPPTSTSALPEAAAAARHFQERATPWHGSHCCRVAIAGCQLRHNGGVRYKNGSVLATAWRISNEACRFIRSSTITSKVCDRIGLGTEHVRTEIWNPEHIVKGHQREHHSPKHCGMVPNQQGPTQKAYKCLMIPTVKHSKTKDPNCLKDLLTTLLLLPPLVDAGPKTSFKKTLVVFQTYSTRLSETGAFPLAESREALGFGSQLITEKVTHGNLP